MTRIVRATAAKSLSIAGTALTAFAVVIPLVASGFGFTWLTPLGFC